VFFASCGYQFEGGGYLHQDVTRVAVTILKNNSSETGAGITFTNALIEETLQAAKGNNKSHTTVLIETENKDAKIRLEPLRQQDRDGGFISLKKDLREGIFAYHRVPARIVSQLIPGQLGGDNKSDMQMFYHFVIKPLQHRLGQVLAQEFNKEFNWKLTAADFDFGDLTTIFETDDEKLFKTNRNN